MRRHRHVFIPILWNDGDRRTSGLTTRYAMPIGAPSRPDQLEEALSCGAEKLRDMWGESRMGSSTWQSLLHAHLHQQIEKHKLDVDFQKLSVILHAVCMTRGLVEIHGDPTLANIVSDGKSWWWIDPLDRPYIPGDPHVDLGKMFQSCLGYENMLLNQPREEHPEVMRQLAKQCGLSYELGRLWCYIHIVRFLPYQDKVVRTEFEKVLKEWK
jgi:hypothetical protein